MRCFPRFYIEQGKHHHLQSSERFCPLPPHQRDRTWNPDFCGCLDVVALGLLLLLLLLLGRLFVPALQQISKLLSVTLGIGGALGDLALLQRWLRQPCLQLAGGGSGTSWVRVGLLLLRHCCC